MFDLSDPQATYILDMQLRRLTKFSRIELETRRDDLQRTIAELDEILGDEAKLRQVVSDELGEVAKTYGTPRRTVLLESAGQSVTSAVPLEVADDPCFVYLSSSGLLSTTGLGRAVTVRGLLGAMRERGCTVLAHGATGHQNDAKLLSHVE